MMIDVVKASGALFYSPPDKMDEWVDPLMRPICEAINTSGWVWTAESCQGHPDATTSGTWGENTNPMIRLVTQQPGKMLECFSRAFGVAKKRAERADIFEIHGFRAYPNDRPTSGWSEILIYIDARTTFQRDQALDVWGAFAELVVEAKTIDDETERCAKIADSFGVQAGNDSSGAMAHVIAQAIRAPVAQKKR